MNFKSTEKVVKIATIGIAVYLLCFGIAEAFFPIRPFWNDEWRLIYNLKFKNVNQLWGTLDLLQECPRVYLTALKKFTAFFDYSYISLRLPALIICSASVLFIFYLKKKLYPERSVYAFLFILILISSQTFTDYIVQVKQYEMELFLCLLVLWQLMELLDICDKGVTNKCKYALLCLSFLAATYFSYTYPIAVAPIIPIIIFNSVLSLKNKENKAQHLLSLYLPLALVSISIVIFYFIDVKHVMADNRMYISYIRACYHGTKESFTEDFWKLFSLVGSGFIYELVFGVLGIASFFYALYRLAKTKMQAYTKEDHFKLYAVSLLFLILCLFLSGKLLGGVPRLTAFAVPSISILIVSFLEDINSKYRFTLPANLLAALLFVGLFGNIITSCINTFTYPEYNNRITTFRNTAKALEQARIDKIPFLFTESVRGCEDGFRITINKNPPFPGKISSNTITPEQIEGVDRLCSEVILKVNPGYKAWDTIPVYQIPDMKWTSEYIKQLPAEYNSAIACDGINFIKLNR